MTISSSVRKAGPYPGNGVAASFVFAFKVFAQADVRVVRATIATGAEQDLVLGTDYTVALNGNQDASPGGSVTLTAGALAATYTLTLTSQVAETQSAVFTNTGGFYPAVLNACLDRLTILVQQLGEKVARSLKVSVSTPTGFDATLPTPTPYGVLGFNGAANGFQVTDPSGATAIAEDVAADLAAVRADLANPAPTFGSKLIAWMRRATGAVARWSEDKQAERVSLADFGGVGDWNGTTGTDNLAAMVAAQNYLTTRGGTLHIDEGSYYFSAPFVLKRGVNLRGAGQSHPAFFNAGTRRGTSLVIAGGAGASLVEFESGVEGHHGIEGLAIYQNGTAAIYAALSVRGVLSPFVRDCTIYCTKGIGMAVGSDASSNLTLYGVFDNLHIRGETAVSIFDAANANTFTGGSWAGTKMTLEVKGPNLCRGLTFNGVSIEGSYTAGSAIAYNAKPTKVYGWNPNTLCYSVDYVNLEYADGAAFNGGYTELGGVPATYDDGTHGVLPLIGTVHVKPTSRGVSFNSTRWASFLVDGGVATYANNLALTNKVHTTQTRPYLFAYQTATQNVPKNTDTTVAFGTTLNTDLITLTANTATVLNSGIFNIKAQVNCGVVAFQEDSLYIEIWVNGSPKYRGANHYIPGATGGDITLVAEQTLLLAAGDAIAINMFHNSGTAGTITLPADFTKTNLVVYQV